MRLTLKAKAVLASISLVVLVMATVAWLQREQLGDEYVSLIRLQHDALATAVADDLSGRLETHLLLLARSALAVEADAMIDAAEQRRFFDRLSGARPLFDGMALIRLDGTVVANDPPLASGASVNVADRDYFMAVLATGRPAISKPLMARSNHRPAVLMAVPVRDPAGRITGVLAGGLNLSRSNLLGDLNRTHVGQSGYFDITTMGADPVYVVHPDEQKLLKPVVDMAVETSGLMTSTPPLLLTAKPIRATQWELHLILPTEEAYAPVRRAQQRTVLEIAALSTMTALLVWIGVHRLLRPLSGLHDTVRRLRTEPDAEYPPIPESDDEIGDLTRDFNALVQQRRAQQAELNAVSDASPLGLFRTDVGGRATYANEACLRILGLRADGACSSDWTERVPIARRQQVAEAWHKATQGGSPWHAVQPLDRPDGSRVLVSVRIAPVLVDGKCTGHAGTVADITERSRNEKAQRTLTAIFDATSDFVMQADPAGNLIYLNPAARRMHGWDVQESLAGRMIADYLPSRALEQFNEEIRPIARISGLWVGESVVFDADRREVPVSLMIIAHRNSRGRVEYFSGIQRDISSEKASQEALRRSEQTLRSLTDALPVLVAVVDREERYQLTNVAYVQAMQLADGGVVGKSLHEALGPTIYQQIKPFVDRALAGERVSYEREQMSSQATRRLEATYIPQRSGDGDVTSMIVMIQDVTERKLEEDRLRSMALLDSLTGLLNRAGFEARLEESNHVHGDLKGSAALLYVDLDRFKAVNDTYGHPVGDELLQIFAKRLTNAVRPSDLVARLGGDEFAIVVNDLKDPAHAEVIADKVLAAAGADFWIDGQAISIGASVGIAIWKRGESGWKAAVEHADAMLYRAKQAGRGQRAWRPSAWH